jgi:phosphate transport system permease protein
MSTTAMGGPIHSAPAKDMAVARALGRRRRVVDNLVRWFCIGATLVGLFFLASIMFTLLWRGLAAMDLTIFTTEFRPTRARAG